MRSRLTRFAYVCSAIVFALLVISPISLRAQEARGTISGTVLDANKASVPGATVTITNVAMGTNHNRYHQRKRSIHDALPNSRDVSNRRRGEPDSRSTSAKESLSRSTTSSTLTRCSKSAAVRKP